MRIFAIPISTVLCAGTVCAATPALAPGAPPASAPAVSATSSAELVMTRLVTLAPDGSLPSETQAELDRLGADKWRPSGMSVLSAPGETPVRVLLLYSRIPAKN